MGFGSGEEGYRRRGRIIHTAGAEHEPGPSEPRGPGASEVNGRQERGGCRVYGRRLCSPQPGEVETWCWEPEDGNEDAAREDTTADL